MLGFFVLDKNGGSRVALTTDRAQTISDKKKPTKKKKGIETYLESPKHQTPLNYASFSSLERLDFFYIHCQVFRLIHMLTSLLRSPRSKF